MELEKEGFLPFLDVGLMKTGGKLVTRFKENRRIHNSSQLELKPPKEYAIGGSKRFDSAGRMYYVTGRRSFGGAGAVKKCVYIKWIS